MPYISENEAPRAASDDRKGLPITCDAEWFSSMTTTTWSYLGGGDAGAKEQLSRTVMDNAELRKFVKETAIEHVHPEQ